jgi:hypothetical protein
MFKKFINLSKLEEKDENKTFIIVKKTDKENKELKSLINERFQNPDNYLEIDHEVIIGKLRIIIY